MTEDAFIISPTSKHTGTVIFMHGLGENGEKWKSMLSKIVKPNIKVICPNADKIPLTLYKGFPTASWFNLNTLDENVMEDESSIMSAVYKLHNFIDEEISSSKISSTKIMLAGFSQGGSLAMYAALTYHKKLAGAFAISSWPLIRHTLPDAIVDCNANIPILQCHGTEDQIVHYRWGLIFTNIMKLTNPNFEFKSYEGLTHNVNKQVLEDVQKFVNKIFP